MSRSGRSVPKNLTELRALLAEAPGFSGVIKALHSGDSAAVDGAWGSVCALSIAAIVAADEKRAHLVLLPSIRDAEEFAEEFEGLTNNPVHLFPAWESLPDANDPGDTVAATRLALVRRLLDHHRAAPVMVTSLPAILQPVPSRESSQKATRTLKSGDELSLDEFS
ncbi:MAG: hypothetical protein JNM43_14825, partial [Planctomycetaceae bacterium]|nr:hypothetical protein [Planctomycetaceae bacterium]